MAAGRNERPTVMSHLDGLDGFALYDAESDRVGDFLASLDDADWSQPTACEGWTRREMIAHLAGVEVYHQACLDGKLAELATEGAAAGATDMDGYNDWLMQRWSGKPPTDVLAEWRELNASSRSRMRELGPRASLPTILGPTELSVFTVHVASEYGTHADDMGIEIPAAEQDTRRDWRLRLSRTVLEESGKGVEIDVDGDSISVGFGDESVVLSTDDFIAAVTARLPEGRLPEALGPALRVLA